MGPHKDDVVHVAEGVDYDLDSLVSSDLGLPALEQPAGYGLPGQPHETNRSPGLGPVDELGEAASAGSAAAALGSAAAALGRGALFGSPSKVAQTAAVTPRPPAAPAPLDGAPRAVRKAGKPAPRLHMFGKVAALAARQADPDHHTALSSGHISSYINLSGENDASYRGTNRRAPLAYGDLVTIITDKQNHAAAEMPGLPAEAAAKLAPPPGGSSCYLSILQNPLKEAARLVGLYAHAITRPFSMACVYEIFPPSDDVDVGAVVSFGKRCRLRHVGTGGYVTFDPAKWDAPVFLHSDDATDSGGAERAATNRDPYALFSFQSTLKHSANATAHSDDRVQIVLHDDSLLRVAEVRPGDE